MSFFATLLALLIEQVRPLAQRNPVYALMRVWARWARRNCDTGREGHAWLAWMLAVLVPAVLAAGVHWALYWWGGWVAAAPWSVLVLYLTLGFRQFSHNFTAIRDALEVGDEPLARQQLAQWQQVNASELPRREIVRHVIEFSVLAAHRHVFGVLFWFSVLAALGLGPLGAVLYRQTEFVMRYWQHQAKVKHLPISPALQTVAARAWQVLDWPSARATALAFAVVGSFEDAVDAWRRYATDHPEDNDGVIIAATAGAINVRLGGETFQTTPSDVAGAPLASPSTKTQGLGTGSAATYAPEAQALPGQEPVAGHLRSVVGLVWRTVVMWMVLLALLTLARLLG